MPTPAQLTALRHRRIHAGLGWETPSGDQIETATVRRTGFVAIVPEAHHSGGETAIPLPELVDGPVVGWPTKISPELTTLFTSAVDPAGGWSFALAGTSLDDIVAHVLAGRGVGVFPASLVEGRSVPGARFVQIAGGPTRAGGAGVAHRRVASVARSGASDGHRAGRAGPGGLIDHRS